VKNASTSPLLQLPLEVRNKIWREVLGDRLIHVKYRRVDPVSFPVNEPWHRTSNRDQDPCRSGWRHIVCENDCRENRPDEKVIPGGPKDIGWLGPHSSCKINYDVSVVKPSSRPSVALWDHKTMHLIVLRTSRQIYVEANQILWSSNTFSFSDGVTLKRFLETRNVHQKRLIHNLRLFIDWQYEPNVRDWNSSLDMASVRSLSGLRSLRLQIVYSLEARDRRSNHNLNDLLANSFYFEGLWRLSTLPLSNVEVAVRTSRFDVKERWGDQHELDEVADGLKTMLLNPKGAEMYAAAQPELKYVRRRIRAGSDINCDEDMDASSSYLQSMIRLLAVIAIKF